MTEKTAQEIKDEQDAAATKAAEAKAAKEAKAAEAQAAKDAAVKAKAEAKAAKEAEKAQKAADAQVKKDALAQEKADKKAAKKAAADAAKASKAAEVKVKMPEQNGIRRPKPDGKCGRIWAIADAISAETLSPCTFKGLMSETLKTDLEPGTVFTEYARWRKFNGVTGRHVVAKPAEPPAEAAPAV